MQLVVTSGMDEGRKFSIKNSGIVIGKSDECDVVLTDPTVSSRHLAIIKDGNDYIAKDLNSTNGTIVEGNVIKEIFLKPNTIVTLGNTELVLKRQSKKTKEETPKLESFGSLLAADTAMKTRIALMRKAATAGTTVLLQGETGVGKSALAAAIHKEGPRKDKPFIVFDCGSVAPTLIESELFGAEKGAYTGAIFSRPGACEQAQGGTLFLDEIEELSQSLQVKLLRVIEEKEIRRLGSSRPVKLDIQIIAASKKDLATLVEKGEFRQDLYYRIAVVCIDIPPLRERPDDIPILCDYFLNTIEGPNTWNRISNSLKKTLMSYSWPGNLRELRNCSERIQCIGEGDFLLQNRSDVKGGHYSSSSEHNMSRPFKEAKEELVDAFEREYLENALSKTKGSIAPAARKSGLNRKYFYDLLEKHGLHWRKK